MTGKGISATVNRAFMVIGSLFFLGGIYLGVLTFLQAPEIYETSGRIVSLRVEKRRPMGLEDIPVDSKDPAHEAIPVYTDSYAVVEYEWNGVLSKGDIVSWSEEPGWGEGVSLPLYLVEGEEDVPLNYYPSEAAGEKKEALIIFLAMPLMGGALALVGFFSGRRERLGDRRLLERVRKLSRPGELRMTTGRTLHEGVNRGNYMIGAICSVIGVILVLVMVLQFTGGQEPQQMLILPFPLLLGLGLVYMGASEFVREEFTVTDRRVTLVRRSLLGRREEERKITSFGGLKENILEKEVPGSLKRRIYREQVLIHEDPLFNGLSIALIPDSPRAEEAARELSAALNLPRILMDGKKVILDYPDRDSVREAAAASPEEIEMTGPFPAKYLLLEADGADRLFVTRSFRKSLIWGACLFAAGLAGAVLTGAFVLLIPATVMSLIFDAIGLRRDELEIKDRLLRVERFFLGRTYYRETVLLDEIEEVLSGNDPRMNQASSLEILGGGRRIYFGQAATEGELAWLKQRIKRFTKE